MKGGWINKMGLFGKNRKTEKPEEEEEEKEQEDNEEEEENTYEFDLDCENCENRESYDIPKGKTLKEYLKDEICDNCGCKIIQSSE